MDWPNSKVIALIDFYRNRPVLWNSKLKEYKDRNKRHEAIIEIADCFGVTTEELERKLKNLVCHFLREVKKERDSVKSGSGSGEVYKSKWFAYRTMEFLKDRYRARGMTDSQDRTSSFKEDKSQEHFAEESLGGPPYTPESSQGVENAADSLNETSISSKRSRVSCSRCEMQQQRMQLTTEADSEDPLRMTWSNTENNYASDRFDHLAKNWAEKLRNLHPNQRIYVEKLVNDVFYEGELCSLSRNSKVLVGESQLLNPETQQFSSSFTPVSYSTRYQLPNKPEQQMLDTITDDSFIVVKDEILSADD